MSVGFNISSGEILSTGSTERLLSAESLVALFADAGVVRALVGPHWEPDGFVAQLTVDGQPVGEFSFGPMQGVSWKADLSQGVLEAIAIWIIEELDGHEVWLWSDNGDHAVRLERATVEREIAELLVGVRRKSDSPPWENS